MLAKLLESYLAPDNSVLARTLARAVGEHSPMLRALDPEESSGIVSIVEERVETIIRDSQLQLGQQLDPLHADGAMARFIRSLRSELAASAEDREKQLKAALAALNANDDQSLISRMMRETQKANRTLLDAINPADPGSPIASLSKQLTMLFGEHAKAQQAALELQRVERAQFHGEVREAIARIEEHRRGARLTTVGGHDFEQAMVASVADTLAGGPFIVTPTGNTTGFTRGARVGDLVVQFSHESAFAGAAVVFEAKRDASYTPLKALEELERARANRRAQVGVFVMAATHAPVGFPKFSRYGQDILVTWDESDPEGVAWLQAATITAMALASRDERDATEGDLEALHDLEQRVEGELKRLTRMAKYTENIRRDADKLGDELRKARGKLDLLVRKGRDVLTALDVVVADRALERESPIALPVLNRPEMLEASSPAGVDP